MKLPKKFQNLWKQCVPLLKKGRLDDFSHAKEVISFILNYNGPLKLDADILIPAAIMHDIGHSAILPEHFYYITGPKKIKNGKLVHMLAGAKIAKELLGEIHYPPKKAKEIIEIISMHDADQLEEFSENWRALYDTYNKKIFHDIDSLDRFSQKRIKMLFKIWPKEKLYKILKKHINNFFFTEFKNLAQERLKVFLEELKKNVK